MARCSVDIIGKKMRHLGTVVADDERKALEEAIKQFTTEQDCGDEGQRRCLNLCANGP
jgi:hypothetical protein